MAISNQFTVTTTSQAIVTVDDVTQHIYLHTKHKAYIGNEGVTTSNGYLMDSGDKLQVTLSAGEVLWAVSDAGSGTLHVLISAQK